MLWLHMIQIQNTTIAPSLEETYFQLGGCLKNVVHDLESCGL